jgi:transcriptional regulator NrdR family protein
MKQKEPPQPPKGIECPHCGCRHFYTTHTEPLRDGRIRRRKACRHCGRRLTTFETPAITNSSDSDRYM